MARASAAAAAPKIETVVDIDAQISTNRDAHASALSAMRSQPQTRGGLEAAGELGAQAARLDHEHRLLLADRAEALEYETTAAITEGEQALARAQSKRNQLVPICEDAMRAYNEAAAALSVANLGVSECQSVINQIQLQRAQRAEAQAQAAATGRFVIGRKGLSEADLDAALSTVTIAEGPGPNVGPFCDSGMMATFNDLHAAEAIVRHFMLGGDSVPISRKGEELERDGSLPRWRFPAQ